MDQGKECTWSHEGDAHGADKGVHMEQGSVHGGKKGVHMELGRDADGAGK